jgi:SAM-dependent methyltransferase
MTSPVTTIQDDVQHRPVDQGPTGYAVHELTTWTSTPAVNPWCRVTPSRGRPSGHPSPYLGPMSFDVTAEAYSRFMGRYSSPLASAFVDAVDVRPGQRVLDVGCGPGALTEELVNRVGADHVRAIDPSASFVAAVQKRFPAVSVALGGAEELPDPDATYDVVLAQLVVLFMADPVRGLREMARVTVPGGTVGANVWDHAQGGGPLSTFWRAAEDLDPSAPGESGLAGVAEGQLAALFESAGMPTPSTSRLSVFVVHSTFEEWWEPYTLGVGPAGDYVAQLDGAARDQLRDTCRQLLGPAPFTVEAAAWTAWWHKPKP